MPRLIAAYAIACRYGISEETYRLYLRDQAPHDPRYSWHAPNARWLAKEGSPAFAAMIEVAERIAGLPRNNAEVLKMFGLAAEQGDGEVQNQVARDDQWRTRRQRYPLVPRPS